MKYFINLSAGLMQNKYKGEIIRIQSSLLESHQFDRLSDSLLYNLARGETCMIIDCSSNSVGKVIKIGIPIIIGVLNYYWYGSKDKTTLGLRYLNRILSKLSYPTKRKLKYYRNFLITNRVKLAGISIKVQKELVAFPIYENFW